MTTISIFISSVFSRVVFFNSHVNPYDAMTNCFVACMVGMFLHRLVHSPTTQNTLTYRQLSAQALLSQLSAVGFSFLGTVPFLARLTLTAGWWGRLAEPGKITIALFFALLCGIGLWRVWIDQDRMVTLKPFGAFLMIFVFMYAWLLCNGEWHPSLHLHHAIFAAAGYLFYAPVEHASRICLFFASIFYGVIIQGIDTYGVRDFLEMYTRRFSARVGELAITLLWICSCLLYTLKINQIRKQEALRVNSSYTNEYTIRI